MGLFVARAGLAEGVALVESGEARSAILVAEDAPKHTAEAAEELRHYVRKISGAEVEILSNPSALGDRAGIWVGGH